jgi:hypothetical protein
MAEQKGVIAWAKRAAIIVDGTADVPQRDGCNETSIPYSGVLSPHDWFQSGTVGSEIRIDLCSRYIWSFETSLRLLERQVTGVPVYVPRLGGYDRNSYELLPERLDDLLYGRHLADGYRKQGCSDSHVRSADERQ